MNTRGSAWHEIRLEKVAGEADTSTWPGQMYIWVENLQSTWQNCRFGVTSHQWVPWVEHCFIIQQSTSIGDGLLGLPWFTVNHPLPPFEDILETMV